MFHHFIPLTTSDGVNLWMGNNPDATGLYMPTPHDTEGLGEYEQNRLLGNRAREFILSHPVGFGVRTVKKALLFFRGDTIGAHWNAASLERAFGSGSVTVVKVVMQAYWAFVFCLAVLGFGIFGARVGIKPAAMNPCTVVLAYFTVLYAAIVVSDRYHFPLDSF